MESKTKDRLKIRDEKLNALLDLTNAINANISNQELFEHYKKVITVDLGIAQFALFIKEKTWSCAIQNQVSEERILEIQRNSSAFEENNLALKDWGTSGKLDIVLPISKDEKPIAFIFLGDGENDQLSMSPSVKHMRFVQTLTSILVVAIENKKLQEKSIQQARLKRELELAAEMQNMLLPSVLPTNDHINVQALYQAHGEVGGDYYDFFYTSPQEWICCMADVSGKGISAAFLMAGFQAHIKSIFHQPNVSIEDAVQSLNQRVLEASRGDRFITLFLCRFNLETRIFEYLNCGHNPALLTMDGRTDWLNATIPGLGMLEKLPEFQTCSQHINAPFNLLTYTDGLIEIENNQGEAFGEQRIMNHLQNYTLENLPNAILSEALKFKGEEPFVDDLAILSVQQK
jgi:sigma-B regulation protein RsbU (phosphoserine phosphatase)